MIKSRFIALGLLAFGAGGPAAFALNPTVTSAVSTSFEFFLSGASASDKDVVLYVKNNLCSTGTFDLYQDVDFSHSVGAQGPIRGANWKAFTCTLLSAAPVPAALQGQNVIIHKRNKEGSLFGSLPFANNVQGSWIEFMNVRNTRVSGACTADGTDSTTGAPRWACPISAAVADHDGPRHLTNPDECDYAAAAGPNPLAGGDLTKDTLCRRGTLGFSDTEAEMFQGLNVNARPNAADTVNIDNWSATGLTTVQKNRLTRKRAIGQMFGVAVSNNVFTALQTAQGIPTGAPLDDGSNWPSLSRDQIRKLLSGTNGGVNHWNDVIRNAAFTGALNNLAICRRDQGSGTQSTSNQYFFNYPCDTNNAVPQRETGIELSTDLYAAENFSGDYVKLCLNEADAGVLPDKVSVTGNATYGAIGVLSYNTDPSATNSPLADTWKWVKIDGVLPSLQNAILGKYDYWYETQIAYNTASVNANANESALVSALITVVTTPSQITTSANKGIAALTVNGFLWDDGVNNTAFSGRYLATNPVMGGKHGGVAGFPSSGTPISCRLIQDEIDGATAPNRTQ